MTFFVSFDSQIKIRFEEIKKSSKFGENNLGFVKPCEFSIDTLKIRKMSLEIMGVNLDFRCDFIKSLFYPGGT